MKSSVVVACRCAYSRIWIDNLCKDSVLDSMCTEWIWYRVRRAMHGSPQLTVLWYLQHVGWVSIAKCWLGAVGWARWSVLVCRYDPRTLLVQRGLYWVELMTIYSMNLTYVRPGHVENQGTHTQGKPPKGVNPGMGSRGDHIQKVNPSGLADNKLWHLLSTSTLDIYSRPSTNKHILLYYWQSNPNKIFF